MTDTIYRLLASLTEIIADQCGPIVRDGHNQLFEAAGIDVSYKTDETPVTAIDYKINNILKEWAHARRLGYVGEEGNGFVDKDYVLYVDSLDGTIAFTRGMNTCSIIATIMKMENGYGTPVAAVIHQPLTHNSWTCLANEKTRYMNDKYSNFLKPWTSQEEPVKIRTSICVFPGAGYNFKDVSDAINENSLFSDQQMGAFGISAGLIASNIIDATAMAPTAATESAAMMLIVNGVGGVSCDLLGNPLTSFEMGDVRGKLDFILPNGALFASNQIVSDTVLSVIANHN